jgi:hypothetical protein
MSVQIFLQGYLLGVEEFLCAGDPAAQAARLAEYCEGEPARFLAERGLSPILLGSAGGGQFLLVLPIEEREPAAEFLTQLASRIALESGHRLRLHWASTENLGTWNLIRERLREALRRTADAPGAPPSFDPEPREAASPGGPPGEPVLRGDVDLFAQLLAQADSIETHVSLSVLIRQFFVGETARVAEGRAKVLVIGGDDFALYGSWPDLIDAATELHRLYERFAAENLSHLAGPEGKTLSMAMALPEEGESLSQTFARCGRMLAGAKSVTRDALHLFGRTVTWKEAPEAVAIKDHALRLIREFGCSTQFLDELRGFYPETGGRRRVAKFERPWRFYRRLAVTLDPRGRRARSREFEKVKEALAGEVIGKNVGQARLRPAGRVGLEWAKQLAAES